MNWTTRTASDLKTDLDAGRVSSEELVRSYLDRIERHDSQVSAFLQVDPEAALSEAREIDARRAHGEDVGILGGLPIGVKDILCTRGSITTCASQMLKSFRPPYDATVIRKVRDAGGVLIGKTNLDEFAMGGSTENSGFFPTRNPWDLDRVPGGSSGGSAACVAADFAPLAIGTDTGGSIRQPAAFCGVTGLKPTYGRISRYGLIAYASSLDQVGPFGRSVADVALLLQAMAGHDPLDSTSADVAVPNYTASLEEPLKRLRLGVPHEHFDAGLDPEISQRTHEALGVFRALGAEIVPIHMPHSPYGIAAYYVIASSEASSNLARYDGVHYGHRTNENDLSETWDRERRELEALGDERALAAQDSLLVRMYRQSRAEGLGTEVKRRIMLGTYALSAGYYDAYYLKALQVRRLIREDYDHAFTQVDVIISPAAPGPAFPLGAMAHDPLSLYLQDLYTVGANLAGVAGIAIPCGFTRQGLPIGLQLQAAPFQEERLLRAAAMYQRETDWHQQRPSLP